MSFFKTTHKSSKSKARVGEITTDHGVIHTPAFVPVGTKGTIKGLTQEQVIDLHIQLSFVNTYHLVTHPGVELLERAGGIHTYAKYTIPLMSDSGGFQVFSLAQRHNGQGIKHNKRIGVLQASDTGLGALATPFDMKEQPLVEKISEDGVIFRSVYDGQLINFTPETSMDFQRIIGADINMAFDECTYYPATHEYTEKAMNRTHEWLKRCVKHRGVISSEDLPIGGRSREISKREISPRVLPTGGLGRDDNQISISSPYSSQNQYLYGIIQGGTFEDLRKKSAEFVVAQNTPGVAIGGVSVGETKEEMRKQVEWVAPYLPADRPVHLLGVGQVDDIIDIVKQGIDTFDCVEPTRVARMGSAYQTEAVMSHLDGTYSPYDIDLNKSIFKADLSPLDATCACSTCINYSKSYIHHLFKQRELLGYTLLSYHNLYVMERLMERVRGLIQSGGM